MDTDLQQHIQELATRAADALRVLRRLTLGAEAMQERENREALAEIAGRDLFPYARTCGQMLELLQHYSNEQKLIVLEVVRAGVRAAMLEQKDGVFFCSKEQNSPEEKA